MHVAFTEKNNFRTKVELKITGFVRVRFNLKGSIDSITLVHLGFNYYVRLGELTLKIYSSTFRDEVFGRHLPTSSPHS